MLDLDRMLLNEGYTTTKQLLLQAEKDTDPVSSFVAGSCWADATSAIMIVKGGKAKQVYDLLVANGLITPGKPVVGEAQVIKVFALDDIEYWAGASLAECLAAARAQAGDDCYLETSDQFEVSAEAMERLTYDDEGVTRTFAEQLQREIAADAEFPRLFAATDY